MALLWQQNHTAKNTCTRSLRLSTSNTSALTAWKLLSATLSGAYSALSTQSWRTAQKRWSWLAGMP